MISQAGRSRDGVALALSEIKLRDQIAQAIDEKEFVLIPQVSSVMENKNIRSAMIAPIVNPKGCFGVLYVDNAMDQDYYLLSDLDYLMLLTIHTAAMIKNF